MTDTANNCTYISQYWHEFTGRDPAKDLGFTWIEALHPEDRERAARDLIEASQSGRPCSGEYRIRSANGEYGWFHDMGVAYYNADGSYAGTCVDITQHKRQAWAGQRVRQSLLLGQEAERKRLASELHDDISQRLVLTGLAISDIQRLVPAGAEGLKERLRSVRDQVEAISLDIHRLSRNLHPATVVHLGLETALSRLCAEFSEQGHINVEFAGGPMADQTIAEDLALALFRITQEALANVSRHSGSPTARVSLSEREGALHLSIADQGTGFDVDRLGASAGLGLTSIRERAWLIGGDLRIRSAPSQGTQLDLIVPLGAARNSE
jgi:PAS domain S-box-containing protein